MLVRPRSTTYAALSLALLGCPSPPPGLGSADSTGTETSGGEPTGTGATATAPSETSPPESDASSGPMPDVGSACTPDEVGVAVGPAEADLVIVVDNGGSMDAEAAGLNAGLTDFLNAIVLNGVSLHLALISSYPGNGNGICIQPPLGSGGCPSEDDNPPAFIHVDRSVDSNNALSLILQYHDEWMPSVRPTASKQVLVVSDDDSELAATDFVAMWDALHPSYEPFTFHALAAPADPTESCLMMDKTGCCAISAAIGTVYMELCFDTGGRFENLCMYSDYEALFTPIADDIVAKARVPCSVEIPAPPRGQALDPALVNVRLHDDAGDTQIGAVADAAACDSVSQGWYYDDPSAPTAVSLCPQTCALVDPNAAPRVDFLFGCATQEAN